MLQKPIQLPHFQTKPAPMGHYQLSTENMDEVTDEFIQPRSISMKPSVNLGKYLRTEPSENDIEIKSSHTIYHYKAPQAFKPMNKCSISQRMQTCPDETDEIKTLHMLTRYPTTQGHQLKSPLRRFDDIIKLKTKEGILQKKKNPKDSFKKSYRAQIKDGMFQLFEIETPFRMKITLRFHQVKCYVEIVKDALKVVVGNPVHTFYLAATDNNELKEWHIAFQFALKMSRMALNTVCTIPKFYRNHIISLVEFQRQAQNLDLILFRSKNVSASVQRLLTSSEYDHVAMVLRTCEDELYLFEANSEDGVGLWNWQNFIAYDWSKSIEKYRSKYMVRVAFRHLSVERPTERIEQLQEFVRAALGKKYQLTLSKLFKKKSVTTQDPALRTFFCSELVAAALKKVGLLRNDLSSTQYWPKDFSDQRKLELKEDAEYSHEMLLELQIVPTKL